MGAAASAISQQDLSNEEKVIITKVLKDIPARKHYFPKQDCISHICETDNAIIVF